LLKATLKPNTATVAATSAMKATANGCCQPTVTPTATAAKTATR